MARVLHLHDGERVTIRHRSTELLDMAAEWTPADPDHRPPRHYHPRQDEQFVVHEGELTVRMADETVILRPGDSIDIPRGTPHSMWNSGTRTTRATWQLRPSLRTEEFFTAVHQMRAAGAVGKGGMIAKPAAAVLFQRFPDEFRLVMPERLRRPVIAALASIGRRCGYQAS